MSWLSLSIYTDAENAEALCDALLELGAMSASIEDAHAETEQEQAIFGEPNMPVDEPRYWEESIVRAFLERDAQVADLIHELETTYAFGTLNYQVIEVEEQDWVRLTQSQFDPIQISPRLWIVPSWHTTPDPDAVNLILDPGLAFGTGSHPTTKLCLTWLDDYFATKASKNTSYHLLDYGCGSGILAIAALKLAQRYAVQLEATGVDIDPLAVEASHSNAEINAVADKVAFYLPRGQAYLTLEEKMPYAELVVANILANPLKVLAPILTASLKPNGWIILSGILKEQTASVQETYAAFLPLEVAYEEQGWVCLVGQKVK